ncbi:MAG: hypothetical protein U0X73_10675 [Thermoanaerobaculia bacterium]
MHSNPPVPSGRSRLAGALLALGAGAAGLALAGAQGGELAAAETAFLALATLATLAPLAILAAPGSGAIAALGLLTVAATWALPHGGGMRSAVIFALLLVALAAAAWRWFRAAPEGSFAPALGLAFAVQVLARGAELHGRAFGARPAVVFLLLPIAAALALATLDRTAGRVRAAVVGALVLTLGPGWTAVGTTALVALAAAEWTSARGSSPLLRWGSVLAPAAALAAFDPWAGALVAASGLVRAASGRATAAAVALAAVAALAAVVAAPIAGSTSELARLLAPAVLLPALVGGASAPREGRTLAAALALALAASWIAPFAPLTIAPLAALALAAPRSGIAATGQATWSGGLALATLAAGAPPWLRGAPLASAAAAAAPRPLATLALALLALFGWARLADRRGWLEARARAWAPVALAAIVVAAIVLGGEQVVEQPLLKFAAVADRDRPRLVWELSGAAISGVVIDSYLTNSTALAAGTPVATLVLSTAQGERRWQLRVGRDSAEWAIDRPDVRRALAAAPPEPWLGWFPASGDFYGHTFRSEQRLEARVAATRLVLERSATLPDSVELALFQVATRR